MPLNFDRKYISHLHVINKHYFHYVFSYLILSDCNIIISCTRLDYLENHLSESLPGLEDLILCSVLFLARSIFLFFSNLFFSGAYKKIKCESE